VNDSWVGKELHEIRNAHASFHSPLGTLGGMIHTGFSCFISKGREPWTLKIDTTDSEKTKPAKECEEITYPKPDGVLSFDLLTNLQRSGESSNLITDSSTDWWIDLLIY
jgi:electron-transferring-flavoprotein dehydrogenase